MFLKDIISVRGTSGLFKLLKVTRGGLLLETIDKEKKKLIKNINFSKATPLDNIAIYSKSGANAIPIQEVFTNINKNKKLLEKINSKSSPKDIKDFMEKVLPEYDEDKLPPSQVLKIISWYKIISEFIPDFLKKSDKKAENKKEKDLNKELSKEEKKDDKQSKEEKIEELEIKEENVLSKKFSHPKEEITEVNNKVSPKSLIKNPIRRDQNKSKK